MVGFQFVTVNLYILINFLLHPIDSPYLELSLLLLYYRSYLIHVNIYL